MLLINTALRPLFSHLVYIDGRPLDYQLRHLDQIHPRGWTYQDAVSWLLPQYLSNEVPGLADFLRHELVDPAACPQPATGCLAMTEGDREATGLLFKYILPFIIFAIGGFSGMDADAEELFDSLEEEVEVLWIPSRRDLMLLSPYLHHHPLAHDCDEPSCRKCHVERRAMYRKLIIHAIWTQFFNLP